MTTRVQADELERALLDAKEAQREVRRLEAMKQSASGTEYMRICEVLNEWHERKTERYERFVELSLAASKEWA